MIAEEFKEFIANIRLRRNAKAGYERLRPEDDDAIACEVECAIDTIAIPILEKYIRTPCTNTTMESLEQEVNGGIRALLGKKEDYNWPGVEKILVVRAIKCPRNPQHIHLIRPGNIEPCGCRA